MEPLFDKIARRFPLRATIGTILSLSVVLEILFFLVVFFFGGDNSLGLAWSCFHFPASFLLFGWLSADAGDFWEAILYVVFVFLIAVLQWWLIIFASVRVFRYFRKK